MKFKEQPATPSMENVVSRSVNFEVTIADLARRSERRAWWVAFAGILMALILAGGYFLMLPLKEKVPYLVMADAYTGTSTVARLRGDFSSNQITTKEAINRSNVSHYVLARESYDSVLLGLRDWVTVYAMSASNVAGEYRAQFSADNPVNPRKLYGTSQAVRVNISSIVLNKNSADAPIGATVRIERRVVNKGNGSSTALDNKIITMMFAYKNNLKMDDRYRIENPLGFQVTGYRVDNDYSTALPRQPLSSSMEVENSAPVHAAEAAAARRDDAAPPAPEYGESTPAGAAPVTSSGAATR